MSFIPFTDTPVITFLVWAITPFFSSCLWIIQRAVLYRKAGPLELPRTELISCVVCMGSWKNQTKHDAATSFVQHSWMPCATKPGRAPATYWTVLLMFPWLWNISVPDISACSFPGLYSHHVLWCEEIHLVEFPQLVSLIPTFLLTLKMCWGLDVCHWGLSNSHAQS